MKLVEFLGSSRKDLCDMPATVRHAFGVELMAVQFGAEPRDWKPMPSVGAGVVEIRHRDENGAFRLIYVAKFKNTIYVLHAFHKKTQKTLKSDIDLAAKRYKLIEG
jgi:phage-related protein